MTDLVLTAKGISVKGIYNRTWQKAMFFTASRAFDIVSDGKVYFDNSQEYCLWREFDDLCANSYREEAYGTTVDEGMSSIQICKDLCKKDDTCNAVEWDHGLTKGRCKHVKNLLNINRDTNLEGQSIGKGIAQCLIKPKYYYSYDKMAQKICEINKQVWSVFIFSIILEALKAFTKLAFMYCVCSVYIYFFNNLFFDICFILL